MAQDDDVGLLGVDTSLTRTASKYEESHDGSSSDSEFQQAIEIVFNPQNTNRRKSSIIPQEAERMARRIEEQKKHTACFVHTLLDRRKKFDDSGRKLRDVLDDDRLNRPLDKVPESPGAERKSKDDGEIVHSRLLTKKQLSEMALGIRELSKKLGSLKVKLRVKTIFLLTKAHDEELIGLTREVAAWLLHKDRETPYIIFVENTLENNRKFDAEGLKKLDPTYESRLKYWNNDMTRRQPHTFDFVVSLGGDGTVLYASWLFQRIVPPVLSFSLGSLGFLTKFDFADYQETLTNAFRDGVVVSLRLRFEGTIMRNNAAHTPIDGTKRDLIEELIGEEGGEMRTHKPDGTFHILNDIVVDRGPNPTMSTIEVFGDDEHFTTVQADGVCVSTPTGSTAYNLAAGGSLCHPENPVMMVTAICAHTLSFRPIILPDTIVLRVGVPYDARTSSWASFDGRERIELHPGDYVTISASRYPFANVMPPGRRSEDWINSISRTLAWNSRQRQKAFKEWEDENKPKKRRKPNEDENGIKAGGET